MTILILIGAVAILLFGGVVAFGAPYLPTLSTRVEDALDLLDLKEGQTMLELGCGDGRLLKAAAKRGITAVGYELNPLLVAYAKISCWPQRSKVTVYWGDYWRKDWPPADGMYVFLLKPYMSKLHNKLTHYASKRKLSVVSFAFEIEEKKHVKEQKGMFLYKY